LAGCTGAEVKHICPVQRSPGTLHFIRLWIPELREVPEAFLYKPWTMNQVEQEEFNIQLGIDYPLPIVKLSDPPPIAPLPRKKKKKRLNRIIRKKKMKR
jgi:hypothetical protein